MNDGATWLSSLSAFLGGLMYGYAFIRTGRLWLPIGLHFMWNYAQGFLFGFPVSGMEVDSIITLAITGPELLIGNAYGPEGSVSGIIARLFVIAGIAIWPVRRLLTPQT